MIMAALLNHVVNLHCTLVYQKSHLAYEGTQKINGRTHSMLVTKRFNITYHLN